MRLRDFDESAGMRVLFGVRWQSGAATPLFTTDAQELLSSLLNSKAPSPLRSAGALQNVSGQIDLSC